MAMDPVLALRGSVRASDADRERAVAGLRRHYAAGRLDTDELEQRVRDAYAARWRGELRSLLRDMPLELPVSRAGVARRLDSAQRTLLHVHVACWVVLNTLLIAAWAWGGGHGVWPALVLLPTTLVLARHARGSRALSRRLGTGESPRDHRRALV